MTTTALMLLCLISMFDYGTARSPFTRETIEDRIESKLGNPENSDAPIRLPRRFHKDRTHEKWLRIENQTGFDGRVDKILIDSDEEKPGIHAYGLPKKNLEDNGIIQVISSAEDEMSGVSRNGRLVEAYGMSKERLENNGQIERLIPPVLVKDKEPRNMEIRVPRSVDLQDKNEIGKKTENDLEDLEAQDAKVFRPLFVYRQQVAKRQNRNRGRNQVHSVPRGNPKPYNDRRPRY